MLVPYENHFQGYNAQGSHENERINVDESIICSEECVDLVDGASKDTGKTRQMNKRQSKRNVGKQDPSDLSKRALEHRSNNNMRLRPLAPIIRIEIPSEQGVHHFASQTIDRICPGQATPCQASSPVELSSAIMGHSISDHSIEYSRNVSSITELPMSPQLCSGMNDSIQHMKREIKPNAPVPGVQKNQDATNSMKRPAEGISAPKKKSRKTKSHNDVEESDRDRDCYSGIDEAGKSKEEKFACPFYRKDPMRFLECINVKMVTISIVKQHLKRRHAANSHCSVCNACFSSSKLFEDHKQKGGCSHSKISSLDSIPPHILKDLRIRSDRRMSSLTQWHEIWVILFGKSDTTPKPLLDGIAKEMIGIIRNMWSQDDSQIVSNYVQTRGLPASSGEMLSSLLELLDKVEDRFENKPLLGESVEQLADVKRPVMETVIGERDESRQNSAAFDQYPYWECHLADSVPTTTPAFQTSDFLKPASATEDTCDLQVLEVYEPKETCSDFAANGFPAYIEPLPYETVLDPTDHRYDNFKQVSPLQIASPEIREDWGLFDDISLDLLGE